MDESGLAEVVKATVGEDLGSSLEPNGLGGSREIELRDDHAEGTKHGPTSMDDLDGAVLGEGGGVSRETSRVLHIEMSVNNETDATGYGQSE